MGNQLKTPDTTSSGSRYAIGVLLTAVVLSGTGCAAVSTLVAPDKSEVQAQTKTEKSCNDIYNPNKVKGGTAMRAAEHNNRIAACVLVPSKINLSAVDQLYREAGLARANAGNGNPSATGIIRSHYRTDFGLPAAESPKEARDALVSGKSFRDITDKIQSEDLPYVPGGLIVLGTDASGELDISISLGSNSQPENKAHDGRSGLLNSEGLTDSATPISDDRLAYVMAPVGKSRPRG
jgi:hypothetical protein